MAECVPLVPIIGNDTIQDSGVCTQAGAIMFAAQASDTDGVKQTIQILVYAGDPSADADFANLSAGALVIDTTNYKLHMKVAAKGTNTWKSSSALS